MTKILFIDDHTGLRESLAIALKNENPDFDFLQANCSAVAKKILLQNKDCSTLLLDLQVGIENGLSVLEDLRKVNPKIKTLVCTAFYEPLKIEAALKKAVQGFITKTSDIKEIETALKAVVAGKEYFCTEALSVMKSSFSDESDDDNTASLFARYKTLSAKEKEIFDLLAKGLSISAIAETLGKKVKTAENQRTVVYSKMNIHDRLEAVEVGKKLGL